MQDTSFDSFPNIAQTGFELDCVYDVVCPDFSQSPTDPEYTETEISQYLDTCTLVNNTDGCRWNIDLLYSYPMGRILREGERNTRN